ncbi:MAG: ATP-binding protein [Christensenella hongkongensis]|uniref:Anti-sigma regulatory factor (Ser/Thr protein kinase) n=1 Tax=Christensenella hongkongensis TaxID=270498 RepID=A0A0M2NFI5_9FIRM|nr:ATP-binding protein [Christensenella hongkongensis]KKI51294.1 Anti-sigma regulatory factor (Ser/Thr protein kinase) [Christensenella hongkongensis]KUJ31638.1 anti-sigma regulatory factor [Christensenella hongkongensis]MDY3003056.1 ATP-binding protein [Christensenella hongkongensis]TCW26375.1 anti-sigma regulatory factor (Ser/Thr protein kinase) [Christensenella hongkongensis]
MVYTCEYEIKKDDFVAAGEASSQIKNKLKQIGVDAALIRKIAIASYEAEINMIIHSLGGQMKLDIEDDGRITIVCADVGPGIPDIGLAMQEGYSTASDTVREMGFGAGMGLPNINKNSDNMQIESSPAGTTVTMRFEMS